MKRISLLFMFIVVLSLSAAAQNFTVSGNIRGIKNGVKVELTQAEGDSHSTIATTLSKGTRFRLTGHVSQPTLVELRINDKVRYAKGECAEDRGTQFILDNVNMTVSAPCFDSIPKNYEFRSTSLKQEKYVKVIGGAMQQHYQEWRDFVHDVALRAWRADFDYRNCLFADLKQRQNSRELDSLKKKLMMAVAEETAQNDKFINDHLTYAVSLIRQQARMEDVFLYTDAELDAMLVKFKDNEDKSRYRDFVKSVSEMRRYVKGSAYTDFELTDTMDVVKHLSDYTVKGKYNFIDFWASWCGPCRAAIPSVKAFYLQFGDRLHIVSVSVDRETSAWKEAMHEENMPWTQLHATATGMKVMADAYRLTAIPYLMVIDPEGKVIMSTHDPDVADEFLKSLF